MAQYEDVFQHRFTATGAEQVAGQFGMLGGAAGGSQTRLQQWQTTLGFVGPYLQRAGDAMARFSAANVAAHQEMEDVDRQLGAMYARRGYGDEAVAATKRLATELQYLGGVNDEEAKKAATLMASFQMTPEEISAVLPHMASQAWITGASLESIGMAVGKAFGSGQFGLLSRYGITLDAVARAQLKQAQALSASGDASERARGRAMAFDIVLRALAENTPEISERMNTARGQMDRLRHTWADVQEQMGAGVSDLQSWGANFLFNIVRPLAEGNEGMWRWIGMTTYAGGALAKTGGAVGGFIRDYMQFRATMNLARVAKQNLTRATTLDAAAETRKAGIAGREAAAIRGVGREATATAGAMGRLGRAALPTGIARYGMGGMMGGFTSFGGAGSGLGAGAVMTGAAGLGAAVLSTALVAGAAAIAYYLVKRDVEVIAETNRELENVRRGNENLRRMESEARARGITGTLEATPERGWWGNLWASWKRDWSEEDATSLRTAPRGPGAAATSAVTPTGDVLLRVPGDHVLTHQAARDWAHLR